MTPVHLLVYLLSTLVVAIQAQSWDCWDSPTGGHIDQSQVCDGQKNCEMGEDEECFTCANGDTIMLEILDVYQQPKEQVFDGIPQCNDESDENSCYVCGDCSGEFFRKAYLCANADNCNEDSVCFCNCPTDSPSSAPNSVEEKSKDIKVITKIPNKTCSDQNKDEKWKIGYEVAKSLVVDNVHFDINNVGCSSFIIDFILRSTDSDLLDTTTEYIYAAVGSNRTIIVEGEVISFSVTSVEELHPTKSEAYRKGYESSILLLWIMLLYIYS
eukprot:112708_1